MRMLPELFWTQSVSSNITLENNVLRRCGCTALAPHAIEYNPDIVNLLLLNNTVIPKECTLALPAAALAAALVPATSFCANSSSFALEWSDEFDGPALDTSVWRVVEGTSAHPNVDDCYGEQCLPWSGCRAGYCLERNVYLRDGALVLESNNDTVFNNGSWHFTTAAVVTKGKKSWSWLDGGAYRMCVSAQLPGTEGANNDGLWPAAWLLPDSDTLCDPDQGEIDVLEMVNGDRQLYVDYWWQDPAWPHSPSLCNNSSAERNTRAIKTIPDWHSSFHEYAYEAGPSWLAVAIDGVVLANWTHASHGALFYNASYYLFLNTALGGEWPKPPTNATSWPALFNIDYVRVARSV